MEGDGDGDGDGEEHFYWRRTPWPGDLLIADAVKKNKISESL